MALITVSVIVFGSNALRRLDNLWFSSKAVLNFWSSSKLCFGGDSMSDVSSLLTVMLSGLTFGPKVFRTSDL